MKKEALFFIAILLSAVGVYASEPYDQPGFREAYWQCYDGVESTQGGPTNSCKTSEVWRQYSEEYCKGHCERIDQVEKCGVNTFRVNNECSYGIQCSDSDESPDLLKYLSYPITPEAYPSLYVKGAGKGIYAGGQGSTGIILGVEPNPNIPKPTTDYFSTVYDYCFDEMELVEATCYEGGKLGAHALTCPYGCKDGACLPKPLEFTDKVKCVFKDSTVEQECYSNKGKCRGIGTCGVEVKGEKGEQISWKSTCGGYAYTIMDGQNDYAEFSCSAKSACTDSDGGKDYYSKGLTKGLLYGTSQYTENYDYCIYDNGVTTGTLVENYCGDDGKIHDDAIFYCPNGCKDGACLRSDPECISQSQSACQISTTCKWTIVDGKGRCAPRELACIDSDGGSDYYKKGYSYYNWQYEWEGKKDSCIVIPGYPQNAKYVDSCAGDQCFLNEVNCEAGNPTAHNYACPNGCKDGACVKSDPVCGNGICEEGETSADLACPEVREGLPWNGCPIYCPKDCTSVCTFTLMEFHPDPPGCYRKPKFDERGCPIDRGELICNQDYFRYASWQCYDGAYRKEGSESSCKPSSTWKQYSQDYCKGRCDPDSGKCGVNSFNVQTPCSESKPKIMEKVGCFFDGADPDHYPGCYSSDPYPGYFSCESYAFENGVLMCIVSVSGNKGDKITWKSSCGGYAYTLLDGNDETIRFSCKSDYEQCPQGCSCVDGIVFECTEDRFPCPSGCKCDSNGVILYCGEEVCIDSDGGKGYYTQGEVSVKIIEDRAEIIRDICAAESNGAEKAEYYQNLLHEAYCYDDFNYAYADFECPNGCKDGACVPFIEAEEILVPEEIDSSEDCPEKKCREVSRSCLREYEIILEECTFHVKTKEGSCESITNTISRVVEGPCENNDQMVTFCQGCQLDESTCVPIGTRLEKKETAYYCGISKKMLEQKKPEDSCQNNYECETNNCKESSCKSLCEGCLDRENGCLPIGTRTSAEYCDADSEMKSQKIDSASCNNNFECGSNLCVDGACIEKGVFGKLLEWFKGLF